MATSHHDSYTLVPMGLLPDMKICGLRMRRECRKRFSRHRGLVIPTCITVRAWRTCHDAWRDRLIVFSFEVGDGKNAPGIPGACATSKFPYLVRGPCRDQLRLLYRIETKVPHSLEIRWCITVSRDISLLRFLYNVENSKALRFKNSYALFETSSGCASPCRRRGAEPGGVIYLRLLCHVDWYLSSKSQSICNPTENILLQYIKVPQNVSIFHITRINSMFLSTLKLTRINLQRQSYHSLNSSYSSSCYT